jgi:hypothetical protein
MANGENDQLQSNHDLVVALGALRWALEDHARADRLLALTGLTPAGLRARAGDAAVLAAVITFLEAHEPDLLACAAALDIAPAELVHARVSLEAASV